jgi:hypothetical protein
VATGGPDPRNPGRRIGRAKPTKSVTAVKPSGSGTRAGASTGSDQTPPSRTARKLLLPQSFPARAGTGPAEPSRSAHHLRISAQQPCLRNPTPRGPCQDTAIVRSVPFYVKSGDLQRGNPAAAGPVPEQALEAIKPLHRAQRESSCSPRASLRAQERVPRSPHDQHTT